MSDQIPIIGSLRIKSIPMDMLRAHEAQAIANHGGTLVEIRAGTAKGNRGWCGLTVLEALWIMKDEPILSPVANDNEKVLENELIALVAGSHWRITQPKETT